MTFVFLQCRSLKSVIEMQRVYVKFHNNRVTIHTAMLALSIMNRSLAIKVQNVYAKSHKEMLALKETNVRPMRY